MNQILRSNKNIFFANEVSYVSAATNNKIIFVSYIKNNKIFYFELDSNYANTNHSLLEKLSAQFESCYTYFNKFNNRFIIVAKNVSGSNFMFESVNENLSNNMSLSANFELNITTYGDQNEI